MAIKMGTPKPKATDKNVTISGATYSGTGFNVSSEEASPNSIAFNSTGTKMYVLGFGSDRIHQYSLATAYDVSTATYDSVSLLVNGQEGFTFNNTGTEIYVGGYLGGDNIYQYSLTSAFDLTTASLTHTLPVSLTYVRDVSINSAGTRIFVLDYNTDAVYQYSLGTAFDLSTASYDSVSFSVSGQDIEPQGIYFNSTGTKMFMVGSISDRVHQYTLGTGFDLSTASYDSVSIDVSGLDAAPQNVFFNPAGTKMFIMGGNTDSVYEYDL